MRTLHLPLVLADIADLLQAAVPIIFMILYGVAQLVGGKQAPGRKPPAPRPRPLPDMPGMGPNPPGAAGPNAAGQPASLEETLRREVEDFLKRAQGQPVPQNRKAQQQPPQRPQQQPQRQRPAAPAPPARRPVQVETFRQTPPRRLVEQ